ncbi:putative pentatricopeptide repeat-containing protein At1g12700, mitochondrial [Solanum stenotomum]|uniref:putative pentatricopeptide repeat-containing protein At1g12700, mitochondrial n=1 Tax=Solanum stenotomum TaxID=172797 RepID=UPI0020D1190F|nr:putative pentatricopeptide repeat-containing protein At1g12700, mitochondrial [Solanum stenotomum]
MKGISLRNGNGIPFISLFPTSDSCFSPIIVRVYSNKSISVLSKFRANSNFECLDDALILFKQMVTMKPLPSLVDFSKLFKTMIIMKLSLFREMQKLGIPINGVILNSVINSYSLMHRADCGFSVLPIYLKNGISFDVVTFTALIRGFFAENKVEDAVELFKKMVRENICEPDEVMYATVMNGLSKRGHTEKTLSLLRLMEQGNTKPDIFIYTIVVDALCKDRNLDGAINLLNEIKQKGIPPDIVTYSSLIDGLCKLGQWEKVRILFSEMVNLLQR